MIERAYKRFRQWGGIKLLMAYARMGVLPYFLKTTAIGLAKKRPYTAVYACVIEKVDDKLRKQYAPLIERLIEETKTQKQEKGEDVLWTCWFQGLESAPDIVKACISSQKKYIPKRQVVIDDNNILQYVSFPEHIMTKYKKGIIPAAAFSDLLRLELLIRYGGTWADATVLLTGNNYPKEVIDNDLFLFQFINHKTGEVGGISNWFITSCKNNRVLCILREMLYQYWKDYDCTVEYFIFHLFFSMIMEKMPQEKSKIFKMDSNYALILQRNIFHSYPCEAYDKLIAKNAIHKLTYRLDEEKQKEEGTIYKSIIGCFLQVNSI